MAKESNFTNMLLTLLIITVLSALTLGYVYELTKNPIAEAMAAKKNLAIKRVTPPFVNQPVDDGYKVASVKDSLVFYPAKNNSNEVVGYAVETYSDEAFGGRLRLLVGFLPDGSVKEVAVLEHKETPGLGDKMLKSKSDWSLQFEGKDPADFVLKVKKDGGDVDAISGATISSRAYCDAIQLAYDAFKEGGIQ